MALYAKKTRIGLLGGSFNPAHSGHFAISVEVMKRLKLHQVWWLVSPHNPLKNKNEIEDFDTRFSCAKRIAKHPRIRVSDFERQVGTHYTIDTVRRLRQRYPDVEFYWIMGSDNWVSFHRWKCWKTIIKQIPIIIYDRDRQLHKAARCEAGRSFLRVRRSVLDPHFPPCWIYLPLKNYPISASFLRKKHGKSAFNGVY